jgi:hypothetical protein
MQKNENLGLLFGRLRFFHYLCRQKQELVTMKKRFIWMLAAILTCDSMLTSCSNDDNNIVPTPDEPVVLNCAKPDYLQAGDKVALISPAAVRMRLAGKIE